MKSKNYKTISGIWSTFLIFILLALGITGCEVLGPRAIKGGRTDYNSAINKTDVEQLLLNIVLSLKAGGVPSKGPILTVPVGGP